jgi:hypothetical protein
MLEASNFNATDFAGFYSEVQVNQRKLKTVVNWEASAVNLFGKMFKGMTLTQRTGTNATSTRVGIC